MNLEKWYRERYADYVAKLSGKTPLTFTEWMTSTLPVEQSNLIKHKGEGETV